MSERNHEFTTISVRPDTLKAVRVAAAKDGYSSPEQFLREQYVEQSDYDI